VALEYIAENLENVRARMNAAAGRANRDPGEITLIAVSKTFSAEHVRAAWAAGQQDFGENKVQEALQKIADTAGTPMKWHLIGHLQSNKARKAAGPFACIRRLTGPPATARHGGGCGRRDTRNSCSGRSGRRSNQVRCPGCGGAAIS
jgi:hypothetical protein